MRIQLYRRARQEMVVLVVAHQVITDAWPMTTLIRELETLYSEQARGQMGAPSPGPRVTCGDLVRLYRWVSGSWMPVHPALRPDPFNCRPGP